LRSRNEQPQIDQLRVVRIGAVAVRESSFEALDFLRVNRVVRVEFAALAGRIPGIGQLAQLEVALPSRLRVSGSSPRLIMLEGCLDRILPAILAAWRPPDPEDGGAALFHPAWSSDSPYYSIVLSFWLIRFWGEGWVLEGCALPKPLPPTLC